MTVSNVLNGKPGASAATCKLVMREVKRQNYVPTQAARSLRDARQYSVAFLMVDPDEYYLADYLTSQITAGLSRYLNDRGYTLQIRLCRESELQDSTLLRRLTVDGIVALVGGGAGVEEAVARQINLLNLPAVFVQMPPQPLVADSISVAQDDHQGGQLVADHLAARSATSVLAVVSETYWSAFEARILGLRAGLKAIPGASEPAVLRVTSERASIATQEIAAYLRTTSRALPQAVFGGNDVLAIAAIRALAQSGARVPEDVLVVGFNALDFAQLLETSLTTVESRGHDIGEAAGRMMVERLTEGRFGEAEKRLPLALRPGRSTQRSK